MKLNPAFIPHPSSPTHSIASRHQLDSSQNVFLSIRAPSLSYSSSLSSPSSVQRSPSVSTPDLGVKSESLSPSFSSSPTRTSTPLSSTSSLSSPLSPPSPAASLKRPFSHLSPASPAHAPLPSSAAASPLVSPPPPPSSAPSKAAAPSKRVKGTPRGTKGLRYFSILVCRKLSECHTSTYNDIADVLIAETKKDTTSSTTHSTQAVDGTEDGGGDGGGAGGDEHFDEKNIRRRIYDALNVLMAIDMIVKDKKTIRWNGPSLLSLIPASPSSSSSSSSSSSAAHAAASPSPSPAERLVALRLQQSSSAARVLEKRLLLTEQVLEYVGMRYLLERNAELEGGSGGEEDVRLYFPFILVNTERTTTIDCEMSEAHDAVSMRYSEVFSVHDQSVVVRLLGKQREQLWENIPKELQTIVVGLDEEKNKSEERERERAKEASNAAHAMAGDDGSANEEEEQQPAGARMDEDAGEEEREPGESKLGADEETTEEEESELDRPTTALMPDVDDACSMMLPLPSALFPLTSSSSFAFRSSSSSQPFGLQPPSPHTSLLSSSATFLSTPHKSLSFASPFTKGHLTPFPSSSPFPSFATPSAYSPQFPSLPLPSPLHPLPSHSPSPLPLPLVSRTPSNPRPASSSRLFGASDGGGGAARRSGSVIIGNSSILSTDAPQLPSTQITVS